MQWIARKGFLSPQPDGLSRRVLQHPVLTFARGTQPQRVLEEILARMAGQEDIPFEQVRLTCSPSVAAIVELVKVGYGTAAIPSLFVKQHLAAGEFVELPVQPSLPSFVVTLCHHAQAEQKVAAAALVIQRTCRDYSRFVGRRFLKVVC